MHADWLTLSFQVKLTMFQLSEIQIGSGISRVTDQDLARPGL
jgi:hypothetical protein